MILDTNYLIDFFNKLASREKNTELDEQEAGGETGTKTGRQVKKWETGLNRGPANQIANTVWGNKRKEGPTYKFDRKQQWSSGRQMGKTGGSDFV